MSPHPASHEAELERLVTAEDDPRAAFERSLLAACDTCREHLGDLVELAELLDAGGRDARATIEAAAGIDGAPGAEAFERGLNERLRPAGLLRLSRRLRLVSVAMAAAAVLAFVTYRARRDAGPPASSGVVLGSREELEPLQPVGAVDAWGTFTWRGSRPAGGWYAVSVRDPARDGAEAELDAGRQLQDERWDADPERLARWPRRITWELRLYDGSGFLVEEREAEAWLR